MFKGEVPEQGFFWTNELKNVSNPSIRIALENASKYKVDAVYFRFFENGRPPLPQIYLYDYTNRPLEEQLVAEHHRKIWSSCLVPLFFVITNTEIKIFNSFTEPKHNRETGEVIYSEYEAFDLIKLASDIDNQLKGNNGKLFSHFSEKNFDTG
ncbi:MAG: hypothetical protein KJ607_02075, partial [Bacteroidetes bacterium]|nr:hypothetical protein [Bacteroidota bacterium]